jgi:hypothetical protein
VGSLDVNTAQVKQGMAWMYRQYNRDKSLLALEQRLKTPSMACGQSLTQYRPGSTGMAAEQAPPAGSKSAQALAKTKASSLGSAISDG